MDDYHPHYVGYGWPDGLPLPAKQGRRGKMRRALLRLIALQEGICFYCTERITPNNANVDHVVPLSAGGSRAFNNLAACHISCNTRKGRRLPSQQELNRLQILHKNFTGGLNK